jgi:hypothetical protein
LGGVSALEVRLYFICIFEKANVRFVGIAVLKMINLFVCFSLITVFRVSILPGSSELKLGL